MVALVGFALLTAVTARLRVRRSSGRRRAAWQLLSIAVVWGILANTLGLAVHAFGLGTGWQALTNVLLLGGLVCCVVGLLLFPDVRRRATDIARIVLDGIVVGGSVLFVVNVVVFPQLWAGASTPSMSQAELLVLPTMDVLIATLATLLITRSGRPSRVPLVLVGAGFWLYALSDLAYVVRNTLGMPVLGSWWDLGWIAGYLLFTLAALHPTAGLEGGRKGPEASGLLSTIIVFALFLVATGVSLLVGESRDLGDRLVWGCLILAVVGRQVLLVLDNDALRRGLEARVRARTRELRRITEQRELLLASVADGTYGVGTDGRITMVNAATTRLLRRPESELLGSDAHALFHAPQPDGTPFPAAGCYITEAIESGLTATAEEDIYIRGDGRHIVVEATASPLSSDDGISGAVVTFRDVSARHEMDRMKHDFVSFVSHELRTPLTSIRGALGLISGGAMGDLPAPATRMIEIASAGSVRLSQLVNDLLDIERIDSGMLPMTLGCHDAAAVCADALAVVTGMADAAGVCLESGPCAGGVWADRDRLVQALVNLLGNAIRFSDKGATVRIECRQQADTVAFSVSDHGRGIPADQLEAVFGRFSQVDATDEREKAGTGLGLAICRSIVQRLNGKIWAESVHGEGATFHITLPSADADQKERIS